MSHAAENYLLFQFPFHTQESNNRKLQLLKVHFISPSDSLTKSSQRVQSASSEGAIKLGECEMSFKKEIFTTALVKRQFVCKGDA